MWWAGARPKTLPASVVPVLVGTAVAAMAVGWFGHLWHSGGWVNYTPNSGVMFTSGHGGIDGWTFRGIIIWRALAAMVVALFIQIGTNFANDYSDCLLYTSDAADE